MSSPCRQPILSSFAPSAIQLQQILYHPLFLLSIWHGVSKSVSHQRHRRQQKRAPLYQSPRASRAQKPVVPGQPYNNEVAISERHSRILVCVTQATRPRPPGQPHYLDLCTAATNNPPRHLKQHLSFPRESRNPTCAAQPAPAPRHGFATPLPFSWGRATEAGRVSGAVPLRCRIHSHSPPSPGFCEGRKSVLEPTGGLGAARVSGGAVYGGLWWGGSDWGGGGEVVVGGLSGWEGCLDAGWRHWLGDCGRWIMDWGG